MRRKSTEYADWQREKFKNSPDEEGILAGRVKTKQTVTLICPEHGPYQTTLKAALKNPGHVGCYKCRMITRAHNRRSNSAVGEEVLADIHPDCLEGVRSGRIPAKGKARFVCSKHGGYTQGIINHLNGHKCPACSQGNYRSKREVEMQEFIERLGFSVEHNIKILGEEGRRKEIDLYIPALKVGFEFNGQWYHSLPNVKERKYHQQKTQQALTQGIRLYHLWEDSPAGLCKSIIAAKLGKSPTVIPARKCDIIQERTPKFFSKCHIDGDAAAKWQWSLFYGIERVAAMSIRITNGEPEIARFACKRGVTVIGGYHKLLKHAEAFLKKQGFETILTYCNRDLSPDPNDNIYTKMGFTLVQECPLIYWYWATKPLTINGKTYQGRIARQVFQKHKILKDLGLESTNLTEMELVAKHYGAAPVFNSGNFKYRKHL